MLTSEILYQERWRTARQGGVRFGKPGSLMFGGKYVQGLLKIVITQEEIAIATMIPFFKSFFNYKIPFESIIRCDVCKRGLFWGNWVELEFHNKSGEKEIIQFTSRNPEHIKQLCGH